MVVYVENAHYDVLVKCLVKEDANPCGCGVRNSTHWPFLKALGVPVFSYFDFMCGAARRGILAPFRATKALAVFWLEEARQIRLVGGPPAGLPGGDNYQPIYIK